MDLVAAVESDSPLAELWESRPCVRARARENKQITMWPKPDQVGVPTSPACSLNSVPLTLLAIWWSRRRDLPQTVPIQLLRDEVWVLKPWRFS